MLKDEKIRKLAKKTFIEFFETPEGFKMTYEGMSNGLNSQKTKTEFKNSIQEFLYEELKDENNKVFMKKSLDNFLYHK